MKPLPAAALLLGLAFSHSYTNAAQDDSKQASSFGVGLQASFLGGSLSLTIPIIDHSLNVRGIANKFSYDYSSTEDGINYNFDLDLSTQGLMLDYHPYEGTFRLTAGLYANGNELNGQANLNNNVKIGDVTFTPEQVGNLDMTVDFDSTAPYLGIGWGNAVSGDGGFSFACDFGVLLMGPPNVDLQASGGLFEEDPSLEQLLNEEIDKEERKLEEDLENFKVYPVMSFGAAYAF